MIPLYEVEIEVKQIYNWKLFEYAVTENECSLYSYSRVEEYSGVEKLKQLRLGK